MGNRSDTCTRLRPDGEAVSRGQAVKGGSVFTEMWTWVQMLTACRPCCRTWLLWKTLGGEGVFRQQGRQLALDVHVGKRDTATGAPPANPRTTPRSAPELLLEWQGEAGLPSTRHGGRGGVGRSGSSLRQWLFLLQQAGGYSLVEVHELLIALASLVAELRLQSTWASVVVVNGLICSMVCGIFNPTQGLNPYPLHWQANAQPLDHQGSLAPRSLTSILAIFSGSVLSARVTKAE